jgi:bifunctional non-homologous end joining protein LigD
MPTFPEWVEPMAATLTQERFTAPEWIFERKFDGIRLLAFKQGSDVRLLSRNRLPQHIPSIVESIAALGVRDLILDGEATWAKGGVAYHVFDVIWLDGHGVTALPLHARLDLLKALPLRSPVERSRSTIPGHGTGRAARAGKASLRSGSTRRTSTADRGTG